MKRIEVKDYSKFEKEFTNYVVNYIFNEFGDKNDNVRQHSRNKKFALNCIREFIPVTAENFKLYTGMSLNSLSYGFENSVDKMLFNEIKLLLKERCVWYFIKNL